MFAGPTSFEYSARQKLKNKIDGERLQKALASVSDWLWQQKVAKLTKKEKKAFKKNSKKAGFLLRTARRIYLKLGISILLYFFAVFTRLCVSFCFLDSCGNIPHVL